MDAKTTLRTVRTRAGMTLRALAERAGTSHATLAAYESGRKSPNVATFRRIAHAAGFEVGVWLQPRPGADDRSDRGRELVDVLRLAAQFPARHGPVLEAPVFPRPLAWPARDAVHPETDARVVR